MKTIFLGLQNAATACIADGSQRGKILAAAVAIAVAARVALPTSPVDNPSEYYETQLKASVRSLVGEFNEALTFDMKQALALVRQYWLIRYTSAHPLTAPVYATKYGFFDSLLGVGLYVEDEHYKFVNDQKAAILTLASTASFVVAELQKNG